MEFNDSRVWDLDFGAMESFNTMDQILELEMEKEKGFFFSFLLL